MRFIAFSVFFLSMLSLGGNAQTTNVFYRFNVDDIESKDCNGSQISTYKNLDVFVTKDNTFFGERDSTICLERKIINLGSFTNALAIESSVEDRMIWIADTSLDVPFKKDSVLQFLDDSYRRNCRIRENERWMLVEVFDTTLKQFVIDTMSLNPGSSYCYCGNKYYRNIKALYVGVTPYDITSDAYVISRAGLGYQNNVKVVADSVHVNWRENDSTYNFTNWGVRNNFVFTNPDTNLLSDKVHTITFEPFEPVTRRVTINAEFFSGVFVQPFVAIKGGLFDTVNNIRHKLKLNLIDSNLCFEHFFIELVFNGDDEMHFYTNKVHHRYNRSCLMFEQKAKLVVEENGHLEFGNDGNGILAVKPGASIVLEPNADLTINGQLALLDYKDWIQGGNVDIHLKTGNKLEFGKGATVSNRVFEHGSVKLHVYLEGGELDLTNLDEKSKELIVVYNSVPKTLLPQIVAIEVYPNPTNGKFNVQFNAMAASELTFKLVDNMGVVVNKGQFGANYGPNDLSFDLSANKPGAYTLELALLGRNHYFKIILLE